MTVHHQFFHRVLPQRLLLFLALALILFIAFQLVLLHHGRDQGIYSVVGRTVLEGGAPYKDAWDFKPPGIYFVYALSRLLFGPGMHAVRITEALGFLSLVFAFVIFSRRHFGRWPAGFLGGALALLDHLRLGFWNTGQPESFGAVLLAWALVLAT